MKYLVRVESNSLQHITHETFSAFAGQDDYDYEVNDTLYLPPTLRQFQFEVGMEDKWTTVCAPALFFYASCLNSCTAPLPSVGIEFWLHMEEDVLTELYEHNDMLPAFEALDEALINPALDIQHLEYRVCIASLPGESFDSEKAKSVFEDWMHEYGLPRAGMHFFDWIPNGSFGMDIDGTVPGSDSDLGSIEWGQGFRAPLVRAFAWDGPDMRTTPAHADELVPPEQRRRQWATMPEMDRREFSNMSMLDLHIQISLWAEKRRINPRHCLTKSRMEIIEELKSAVDWYEYRLLTKGEGEDVWDVLDDESDRDDVYDDHDVQM